MVRSILLLVSILASSGVVNAEKVDTEVAMDSGYLEPEWKVSAKNYSFNAAKFFCSTFGPGWKMVDASAVHYLKYIPHVKPPNDFWVDARRGPAVNGTKTWFDSEGVDVTRNLTKWWRSGQPGSMVHVDACVKADKYDNKIAEYLMAQYCTRKIQAACWKRPEGFPEQFLNQLRAKIEALEENMDVDVEQMFVFKQALAAATQKLKDLMELQVFHEQRAVRLEREAREAERRVKEAEEQAKREADAKRRQELEAKAKALREEEKRKSRIREAERQRNLAAAQKAKRLAEEARLEQERLKREADERAEKERKRKQELAEKTAQANSQNGGSS